MMMPEQNELSTATTTDAQPQSLGGNENNADRAGNENRSSNVPGANHEERLAAIIAARDAGRNALLEAAHPLLRCLAEIPENLEPLEVSRFNTLLKFEMYEYTRLCEKANLRRDHMLAVRLCLCTALDEVVNQRAWGGGSKEDTGVWSTMALLNHFHGENQGGNTAFLLIGRLANSASEHIQVLEIIHHILCLGFKGEYRNKANGVRDLETIRHRLYTLVAGSKQAVPRELSQHWQGAGKGRFKILRSIPVWVSASVLGLILFSMFSWFKYQLLSQQEAVQNEIAALSKLKPPPKPPQPKLKLSTLLASEISAGLVRVDEDDKHALVVFKGDGMFVGLTGLSKPTSALLDKIGGALATINGKVRVVGHTDNQPIKSAMFANNQALSLERAKIVSTQLQKNGVTSERLEVSGMGDTQPVDGNASNRSANRRVEIELLYPTGLASQSRPLSGSVTNTAPASLPANQ